MSPPHRLAGIRFRFRVGHAAVERAIQRSQHAALEIVEQRRLAVARTRQIDPDLVEQAARPRRAVKS